MAITKTVTRYFTATSGPEPRAGGIRISAQVGEERELPAAVDLVFEFGGDVVQVEIAPDVLERAAALMEKLREEMAGDFRKVCAEHGYFEGYYADDCPGCKPLAAAEPPSAPSLAAGPTIGGEENPALHEPVEPAEVPPLVPVPKTDVLDDYPF